MWDEQITDINGITAQRIRDGVLKAREAFWDSIVASFPEAVAGDFSPGDAFAWEHGTNVAVTTWLLDNVPPPPDPPREFHCDRCRHWTAPDRDDEDRVISPATCSNCGEPYGCGECGFEIDAQGNCLRNESGPAEDVGRCSGPQKA